MATITVDLSVRIAWWLKWYMRGVVIAAYLTGNEPDMSKVRKTIMRGVTYQAVPGGLE